MFSHQSEKDLIQVFFGIAYKLLHAKNADELESTVPDITQYGMQVTASPRPSTGANIIGCEHASLMLLLVFNDYKRLALNQKIDVQTHRINLDLLRHLPYQTTSPPPIMRSLYFYIAISAEIISLPDSIKRLTVAQKRAVLLESLRVPLLATMYINNESGADQEERDYRQAFSLFFNDANLKSPIDTYIYDMKKIYMSKLQVWCAELEASGKKRIYELAWTKDVIARLNRRKEENIGRLISEIDVIYAQLFDIEMVTNKLFISRACKNINDTGLEEKLLQYLYQLMLKNNLLLLSLNHIEKSEMFSLGQYCIESEVQILTFMIVALIYQVTSQSIRNEEYTWLNKDVMTKLEGTSTVEIIFYKLRGDGMASIISQCCAVRLEQQLLHAPDNNARLAGLTVIAEQFHFMLDKVVDLESLPRLVALTCIFDYYYSCLLLCTSKQESELLASNDLQSKVLKYLDGSQNEYIHKFVHQLIVNAKRSGIDLATVNIDYFRQMDATQQNNLYHLAIKAIKSLSSSRCRMNGNIQAMFCKYVTLLLSCHPKQNEDLLLQLSAFYKAVDRVSGAREAALSSKLAIQEEVKVVDKSSFLPTIQQTRQVKLSVRKKATKVTHRPQAMKDIINPNSPYLDVALYCKENKISIRNYYEKYLDSGRRQEYHLHALLGMAEWVNTLDDSAKAEACAVRLEARASYIFKIAGNYHSADEVAFLQNKYEKLMDPWRVKVEAVSPVVTVDISIQLERGESTDKVVKVSMFNRKSVVPTVTAECQLHVRSASAPVTLLQPPLPLPVFSRFIPRKQLKKASIPLTLMQMKTIRALESKKLYPLIHGGAVLCALFEKPPRDIDALCFDDMKTLIKYLEENKESLAIDSLSCIEKTQVIIITYKDKQENGDPVQLDLLCLGKCVESEMEERLRKLAINYGLNGLYAQPFTGDLIDPLVQYERITQDLVFDVAQVCSVDILAYIRETPARVCDLINKTAYFRHHGVEFSISDALKEAVMENREIFSSKQGPSINLQRFDKLFLQGYATYSFDILNDDFNLILSMFPMFTSADLPALRQFCVDVDATIKAQYTCLLSYEQTELMRVNFLSGISFYRMQKEGVTLHLLGNREKTEKYIGDILSLMNFKFTQPVYFSVQICIWKALVGDEPLLYQTELPVMPRTALSRH